MSSCQVGRSNGDVVVDLAELRLDGDFRAIIVGQVVASYQVSPVSDGGSLELLGIAVGVVLTLRNCRCNDVPVDNGPSENQADHHDNCHDDADNGPEEFLHCLASLLMSAGCANISFSSRQDEVYMLIN